MLETRRISGYVAVGGVFPACWIYLQISSDGKLFVYNLPRGTNEEQVQAALPCSRNVRLSSAPGPVLAIVDVGDAEAVKRVLTNPESAFVAQTPRMSNVIQLWMKGYSDARDVKAVAQWADATTATYQNREAEQQLARERAANQPDEDGFVVVTKGPSQQEALKALNKPRPTIQKDDLYRWQKKRKNDLRALQEKFKKDKKRVAAAAQLHVPQIATADNDRA